MLCWKKRRKKKAITVCSLFLTLGWVVCNVCLLRQTPTHSPPRSDSQRSSHWTIVCALQPWLSGSRKKKGNGCVKSCEKIRFKGGPNIRTSTAKQSRNMPVTYARVTQWSATPDDPFSPYQSTTEPPKSSREPLKPKEATERWNVAFLELAESDVH